MMYPRILRSHDTLKVLRFWSKYLTRVNCKLEKKIIFFLAFESHSTQGAGQGVDPTQKLTQPKHAFSGAE